MQILDYYLSYIKGIDLKDPEEILRRFKLDLSTPIRRTKATISFQCEVEFYNTKSQILYVGEIDDNGRTENGYLQIDHPRKGIDEEVTVDAVRERLGNARLQLSKSTNIKHAGGASISSDYDNMTIAILGRTSKDSAISKIEGMSIRNY